MSVECECVYLSRGESVSKDNYKTLTGKLRGLVMTAQWSSVQYIQAYMTERLRLKEESF